MIRLLIAAATGLLVSIFGTPIAIKYLRNRSIGQFIQAEITGHTHKQGTPTMGGVVFVSAAVVGYVLAHVRVWTPSGGFGFEVIPFGSGGLLALLALVGMAVVGFLDDYIKFVRKHSEGLNKRAKFGSPASDRDCLCCRRAFGRNQRRDQHRALVRATARPRPRSVLRPLGPVPADGCSQRCESGRWHGRPRGGQRRPGDRRLHHHLLLAVPQPHRLPIARSSRTGNGCCRSVRGPARLSLVERSAGADLHGRRRLTGDRGAARCSGVADQHPPAPGDPRARSMSPRRSPW